MKKDPYGVFQLGSAGVMRSFGPHPDFLVLDAVAFSPNQIKQILDFSPWSQEAEDRFRGIDGRNITDHRALFEPTESNRPKKRTDEELEKLNKEIEEINRKTAERIAQEEADGVDVAEKYACGKIRSDHDLRPKENL
ncbi:hypothetical protein B0J14DRAFT_591134 [Halenospora varia]|nr:hypothetical protein B0J14DRAFT_591134 [Halenospora varia]